MRLLEVKLLSLGLIAMSGLSLAAGPGQLSKLYVAKSGGNQTAMAAARAGDADNNNRAGDDRYRLVDIKIAGASYVEAYEINNWRVVSGVYGDAAGNDHSFVWFNGRAQTVDNPAAQITLAGTITNTGRLFGNWGSLSEQHAGYYNFLSRKWIQLPDTPGYPLNFGQRMNDIGHAVGLACRGGTVYNYNPSDCDAWSWNGERYDFYNYPGASLTAPYGVNNRNQEVGLWQDDLFEYKGYQRRRGLLQDLILITPTFIYTPTAYDINDNGDILCAAPLDPTGYWPTFIRHNENAITRLPNYPGVLRTFYQGMNEHEDLVGIWFDNPTASPVYAFVAFRRE